MSKYCSYSQAVWGGGGGGGGGDKVKHSRNPYANLEQRKIKLWGRRTVSSLEMQLQEH